MNKLEVAFTMLLIFTLAMIGAVMYCQGIIDWVNSHFGRQGDILVDPRADVLEPYTLHFRFLENAWIGFAVLSALWIPLGLVWLKFKEPKFKVFLIVPTVATLAYLSAEIYVRYHVEELRYPLLTFFYLRLGLLTMLALWVFLGLGVVWLKTRKS